MGDGSVRLLHIVEKRPLNIFSIDDRCRYTGFTEVHATMMRQRFGVDVAIGESVLDCVPDAEDRAVLGGLLEQVFAGTALVEVTVSAEGTPEERRYEVTYTPIPGPDGGVAGVYAVGHDTTAVDRLEAEVWRHRMQLTQSQELARLGHVLIDKARDQVDISPTLLALCGLSPDERPFRLDEAWGVFARLAHPEDRERIGALFRGGVGHEPRDFEFRTVLPGGELRHIRGRLELCSPGDGRPPGLLAVFQDDTEVWRLGRELEENGARLYRALAAAKAGTWEWTPETEKGAWSPELYALYDVEPGHPTDGPSWMDVVHPNDRDAANAAFEDAAARGAEIRQEFRIKTADGSPRWAFSRGLPEFDADGKLVRYVGVDIDITERHEAESEVSRLNEELRRSVTELERANTELNELLYSIAHDLRSPLRAIDGFSLAFAEDYADQVDAAGRDQLRRVRSASVRLGMLFDAVLRLSGVGSGDPLPREVDITALALSATARLIDRDPDRRAEITVSPGMTVFTDETLAGVALRQLLDNAWQFTVGRECAHVEVGRVRLDGEAAFFVRDDGVGFDPRYAAGLFQPFQQLQPGESPGAGVGLAMVRRAVERLGGRCWAEGIPGGGATFWFTLGPPSAKGG